MIEKFCFLCIIILPNSIVSVIDHRKFPSNFEFGVSTSAYQIEGGWNEDGKGENNFDRLTHTKSHIFHNKSDGDIACDSYHKYKEDVDLLKDLGVNFYRFSISWSRILPSGLTNQINQAGVDYYFNLLKNLQQRNIEVMVTLYHFDLPQNLVDLGGWQNPSMEEYFANYARFAFKIFGENVKYWITINEPELLCQVDLEPQLKSNSSGAKNLICGYNILKSHARAYHIYKDEFKAKQKGKISMALNSYWYEPATNEKRNLEAAERKRHFHFGWFAHPLVHGNYPQVMIDRIDWRSQKEGFPKSRLPKFTQIEINRIKGTYDFIGLNMYTARLCKLKHEPEIGVPNWKNDVAVETYVDNNWKTAASSWLKVVPWGLRKFVTWIKHNFNNPEIIITENGYSDSGSLEDNGRIYFYKEYLSALLEAIYDDNANVVGYSTWSLMDNFEWIHGYSQKFGLYYVDFDDPNRTRIPKKSVDYFRKVISTRTL